MPRTCVVALDVGGTRIKAGLVDVEHRVLADQVHDTGRQDGPEAVVERVLDVLDELAGQARDQGLTPVAAGVVLPGIVDEAAGRVVFSANIGWRDLPLAGQLAERTGLPAAVGHDVRAGGLAESVLGAGRDQRDLLFLPIGTGIAGAMIMDGRPYAGGGYAGEIGHTRVDPDGPPCPCGGAGCLESYAAASSIGRRYSELHGGGERVSAAEVAERVAAGEPQAVAIWQDAVEALATALHTYVTICAPRLVVVGGGLSESGELLLAPLREALAARLTFQRVPRIVRAALGDRAGLLGAALLAWRAAEDHSH
ncbi:glucokinase [Thermomonospora echinospora]|uniref:Glucokinase n=1 Tax=Thermomonospora echinospora TaxID=1992 RepID=A0A1H5VCG6_9ACTN|nr:ROK family protein [Thermomonospora echinospora]SEF85009.1 glucokinase [Thermomonospora echinospora]